MTDRTRHEIDLIDSANKDRSYQQANIKKFNDWLETCPCEYRFIPYTTRKMIEVLIIADLLFLSYYLLQWLYLIKQYTERK